MDYKDLIPKIGPVELQDLFDDKVDFNAYNCIYVIHNKLSDKCYIGQAKDLLGRFVRNGFITHYSAFIEGGDTVIYRALRKYGVNNFDVSVLELDLDVSILGKRESYWIESLHTFIHDDNPKGYNMTKGGEDTYQLSTPEARAKAIKTQYERYGMMPAHTPEALAKSHATQRDNNNGVLPFNTPEHVEKMRQLRGGDYAAQCHTKEAHEKSLQSQRQNHGGKLAFHTEEAKANRLLAMEKYAKEHNYTNIMGHCHTPEVEKLAAHNMRVSRLINSIKSRYVPGMTLDEFLNTYSSYQKIDLFKWRIKDFKSELQKDPRWTPEMEELFKDL